ncbi:PIF1-like helicase [Medicago truncatula]|uniref:ATP-dependent DNA helicase n=1 Tax=Medicago truncatula TaxID=3880 RepID=G7KDM3_MEDTR|nr:PIF1-like helicase [Medicago truncatula]
MEGRDLTTFLSYRCLTGPLMTHPVTEMDKTVTKLQLKYRTYIVEYDTEDDTEYVKLSFSFLSCRFCFILSCVLFFLYGYGGTGKTFLWRAMSAAIRSRGEIVLTVASSGIAALLILGGRIAHSRFDLPFIIDEFQARLVIWDEAPMMHKFCFEAFDRSFRDVMKEVDKRNKYIPFGGKFVVFGGDFMQILYVIPKGRRPEIVHATINSSKLWNHCQRNLNGDHIDDVHTPEFLNTVTASGLPNHKLRLKVGVTVMLLRNIDTRYGLCNGTILVITRMGRYVIEERVISESNVGDQVFVSMLSLSPSDVRIPFKFQRRQFPLIVSFAMIINKSQGHSLKHIRLYTKKIKRRHGVYKLI